VSQPAAREDVVADVRLRLEDLVDRAALGELCQSFFVLFGIPVRIYSLDGALLADASAEHDVCAYVNTLAGGRAACGGVVGAAKALDPSAPITHPCFTGNAYRIVPIDYEGRRIGRIILGPYLPAETTEVPRSLLGVDAGVDPARARSLLLKVPRAKTETATRIAEHLQAALGLILFSGHKAFLTSQMHLASVRESYRELEEKTARLQEAYDRLKELDRLKSNFLATVSHELRTPLTSIIGYSEMLLEGIAGALVGEQREFVETIHTKGEQLLALITGLLDLSKLESGTLSVKKAPLDLGRLLDDVERTLLPAARKKGVSLAVEKAATLPKVLADAERLRQVFVNLGDNAIKFTPAGGSITLSAAPVAGAEADDDDAGFAVLAPARGRIEVRVADTGIGIPIAEREKVFDAFYQVDSSSTREYGGTGLGLSIVKRLVESHGGTVTIGENVPRGTVFIVSLPVAGE
jgi:signal transduction histidine kinase